MNLINETAFLYTFKIWKAKTKLIYSSRSKFQVNDEQNVVKSRLSDSISETCTPPAWKPSSWLSYFNNIVQRCIYRFLLRFFTFWLYSRIFKLKIAAHNSGKVLFIAKKYYKYFQQSKVLKMPFFNFHVFSIKSFFLKKKKKKSNVYLK